MVVTFKILLPLLLTGYETASDEELFSVSDQPNETIAYCSAPNGDCPLAVFREDVLGACVSINSGRRSDNILYPANAYHELRQATNTGQTGGENKSCIAFKFCKS